MKLQRACVTASPAGIDSLTRLATQAAGHPPREGEAFLFTGKKRTRMKLLMWDRH
ncbi:IS66 family insertion sequence element accessory protein TnpB, partial [Escherichia coli]|uniref:IS66 family insertion sequence element accessory protein TnpB n=1 Tax=Escherichia coli TaxID=562 RepID=UPI001A91527B